MEKRMTNKPDFLIIGAAKAGTSSLVHYLSQHQDIYFSPIKEPNFFSTDIKPEAFNEKYYNNSVIDLDRYFKDQPLEELFLAFLRDQERYHQLFENAEANQVKGEASTSYLYSQEAPHNIARQLPNVKLIAVLRNPVERAYSHYLMALKFGFTSKSFMEALKEDQAKTRKGWGISELFLELGFYYEQLKRYYELFPSHQIKIILNEELKHNPESTMKDLTGFLRVAPYDFDLNRQINQGGIPRFKMVNEWLNKSGLRLKLASLLPEFLKDRLRKVYLKEATIPPLSNEAKDFLKSFYEADVKKTENLIGQDLSTWLEVE